ncbi:MAG: MerR family transcriptional regulator, partial [Candidatus Eisenbacteria bacterium]|nr:MerR family transcriptional regulator [Candidatus Eisenbacteria bacterium]
AVGDAWAAGTLEVRHEHFFSERAGDLLRSLRLRFEERAAGPLVVLATFPGEAHTLGLQMVALLLSYTGCRLLYLGAEVPVAQIASLARDLDAHAVGISVSIYTGKAAGEPLSRLRKMLPPETVLLVGGEGTPRRKGTIRLDGLRDTLQWGREQNRAG